MLPAVEKSLHLSRSQKSRLYFSQHTFPSSPPVPKSISVSLSLGSQSKPHTAIFAVVTRGPSREEESSQSPENVPLRKIISNYYILCHGEGKLDYSCDVFQSNN